MALIVVDASVVIALLDPADALHQAARRAFAAVAGEELLIPASALAETLVVPARTGRLDEARERIGLLELRVAPADEAVAVEAARLRGGNAGLRLPDAMVLATAEAVGADTVLTGDRGWTALSPRVRLVA